MSRLRAKSSPTVSQLNKAVERTISLAKTYSRLVLKIRRAVRRTQPTPDPSPVAKNEIDAAETDAETAETVPARSYAGNGRYVPSKNPRGQGPTLVPVFGQKPYRLYPSKRTLPKGTRGTRKESVLFTLSKEKAKREEVSLQKELARVNPESKTSLDTLDLLKQRLEEASNYCNQLAAHHVVMLVSVDHTTQLPQEWRAVRTAGYLHRSPRYRSDRHRRTQAACCERRSRYRQRRTNHPHRTEPRSTRGLSGANRTGGGGPPPPPGSGSGGQLPTSTPTSNSNGNNGPGPPGRRRGRDNGNEAADTGVRCMYVSNHGQCEQKCPKRRNGTPLYSTREGKTTFTFCSCGHKGAHDIRRASMPLDRYHTGDIVTNVVKDCLVDSTQDFLLNLGDPYWAPLPDIIAETYINRGQQLTPEQIVMKTLMSQHASDSGGFRDWTLRPLTAGIFIPTERPHPKRPGEIQFGLRLRTLTEPFRTPWTIPAPPPIQVPNLDAPSFSIPVVTSASEERDRHAQPSQALQPTASDTAHALAPAVHAQPSQALHPTASDIAFEPTTNPLIINQRPLTQAEQGLDKGFVNCTDGDGPDPPKATARRVTAIVVQEYTATDTAAAARRQREQEELSRTQLDRRVEEDAPRHHSMRLRRNNGGCSAVPPAPPGIWLAAYTHFGGGLGELGGEEIPADQVESGCLELSPPPSLPGSPPSYRAPPYAFFVGA